jgi:histidinol-phosphatase
MRRIQVSEVDDVKDAAISYSDFKGWGDRLPAFRALLDSAWRTRGFGDFWSHMLVAEGALEAAMEPELALWDMVALDLIVTEAGGIFSNTDGIAGPHGGNGVSTNAALHRHIIASLKSEK